MKRSKDPNSLSFHLGKYEQDYLLAPKFPFEIEHINPYCAVPSSHYYHKELSTAKVQQFDLLIEYYKKRKKQNKKVKAKIAELEQKKFEIYDAHCDDFI